MSVNIVVVGSVAYDTLATPKGRREKALGGSASYFSTVASYFTKPGLVGAVGEDFKPEYIEFLTKRNVDMSGLEKLPGKTFHWSGSYSDDFGDATTHATELNVFEHFSPKLPSHFRTAPFLFLANIHPQLQIKVIQDVQKPRLIALDTMNLWINISLPQLKEAIKLVDILFVNRQEAAMLSGEKKLANAIHKLLQMGPKRLVIKMGELGAMTATETDRFFVPAFPCPEITDPTGAGDSFAGGFMGWIAKTGDLSENNFRKAMILGTVMGSITVENFSLDSYHTLSQDEIMERYSQVLDMIRVV
ncbi:MAG: sugar kinase [Candidatus Riflebacteria bacterium]|nr:sugar kinase [Candidatus Riflebacteria bacterium]